jgi:hypothetical protein
VTYRWKALDEGYNFSSNFISIEGLYTKLCAPKVVGILVVGISRGSPMTKWHLDVGPMARHKVYYKRGKVVASPKSRSWWVLLVCVCLWFVHASRCSNYALINLLFDWCRSMWVIELLVNLPSPIPELRYAPLPPKCYECTPTPFPSSVFTFGLAIESIKELEGVSCIYLVWYMVNDQCKKKIPNPHW